MHRSTFLMSALVAAGLLVHAGEAGAVLPPDLTSGLEARAQVDVDAFGPTPPLSNLVQQELTLPFTRSAVGVADAQAGVFDYAASADIGSTAALRVSGSIANTGTSAFFGQGVPVLGVQAQAKDVITLNSTLTGSYDVTLQMVIDGFVATTGPAARLAPFANAQLQFGVLSQPGGSDSARYDIGTISDTLSVTRTVSGASVDMDFNTFLSLSVFDVQPGASVTGELGNTAFINLILPQGVSLAGSQSGTFGVSIPIPEPQSWALMLLGLAGVAWAARRTGARQGRERR